VVHRVNNGSGPRFSIQVVIALLRYLEVNNFGGECHGGISLKNSCIPYLTFKILHELHDNNPPMRLVITLFAGLFICACSNPSGKPDEEAVKQVVLDFVDDFNDGAFSKAEEYADEDRIHINPGGGIDRGKTSTLKTVRDVHTSFLKGVTMTTDSMNVRFIQPDVAIVIAYHTIDTYTTPDQVTHRNERQIKTYVVVMRNGKWYLTLDQNTVIRGLRSRMMNNE